MRRRSTRSWPRSAATRASPSCRTCCRSTRGCSRAVTSTPTRDVDAAEVAALFAEFYADEPLHRAGRAPPGVRDVRDTNLCRIHATVEPRRPRAHRSRAIDNLWKGAAGQAVQNLNVMLGARRRRRACGERPRTAPSSARAGWTPRGRHASSSPASCRAGFRASGLACGIKPSRRLDIGRGGLRRRRATSAAMFTRNALVAAPVEVPARRDLSRLRAVVVNSGNANVGTGSRAARSRRRWPLRSRRRSGSSAPGWAWPRPA